MVSLYLGWGGSFGKNHILTHTIIVGDKGRSVELHLRGTSQDSPFLS